MVIVIAIVVVVVMIIVMEIVLIVIIIMIIIMIVIIFVHSVHTTVGITTISNCVCHVRACTDHMYRLRCVDARAHTCIRIRTSLQPKKEHTPQTALIQRATANTMMDSDPPCSEKGEVLLRGVGTLRYVLIFTENYACRVSICAVAA